MLHGERDFCRRDTDNFYGARKPRVYISLKRENEIRCTCFIGIWIRLCIEDIALSYEENLIADNLLSDALEISTVI